MKSSTMIAPTASGGSAESSTARRDQPDTVGLESAARLNALRQIALQAENLADLKVSITELLKQLVRPSMLFWYSPPSAESERPRLDGLLCPASGLQESLIQQLGALAKAAADSGTVVSAPVSDQSTLIISAIPLAPLNGQSLLMIEETHASSMRPNSGSLAACVCVSTLVCEWSLQQSGRRAVNEATTIAALIELVSRIQSASDSSSAGQRLADSLQSHLQAETVVIGLCRRGLSDCRLAAISGGQIIDRQSEMTRMAEAVLQESVVRGFGAVCPGTDARNRQALLSHQHYSEALDGRTLVSMPLIADDGSPVGCVLAVFPVVNENREHLHTVQSAEQFLRAGAAALGSCLQVLQKLADSQWLQRIQSFRRLMTTSRLQAAGWIVGFAIAIMLVPVTYSVHCTSELQPVERHYVAAPFDAPLLECLVEPGDIVEKDQLLARLDGKEIRWELAEVQANLNKATKERNTQMSSREFGNAAISEHEIQRLQQRESLLQNRNTSLEIRSPVAGVVVSGDHREAEGVPLEMGQTLFEIAPLDRMNLEVCIPDEDVRHVREGMNVRVQMDAAPDAIIDASIRRIHPRAEIRDGENVFVAEAVLSEQPPGLRPGMHGSAKILTRRHALGWNLFHKPVAWAIGWLGW